MRHWRCENCQPPLLVNDALETLVSEASLICFSCASPPHQHLQAHDEVWPPSSTGRARSSRFVGAAGNSENRKANRIETMKGPAESVQICSVGRRKIAKKIAKNKRCYANTLRPRSRMLLKVMKGG